MATSTLFGYTVEDNDGKLVITVEGVLAEEVLRYLREGAKSGRGAMLISRLLPVRSLGRLLYAPVNLTTNQVLKGEEGEGNQMSIEQIFNQGVDQNLDTFEQQLALMRAALEEKEGGTNAEREPGTSKAKKASKSRRRTKA